MGRNVATTTKWKFSVAGYEIPTLPSVVSVEIVKAPSNAAVPLREFVHLIQPEVQFQRSGAKNRNFDSSPHGPAGRDCCSDRALRAHV